MKTVNSIQLFAHNQEIYNKIQKMWKTENRVAVIQATGTGKSYLILKCLYSAINENKLILAPSIYILEQLQNEAGEELPNTMLMTYSDLSFDTENKIKDLDITMIFLDEFHRCGAETYNNGILKLLEKYPNAKVLGTTATPVRFLDNERDMSEELFKGNIANNLNLSEAIVREILPMPKYISALYTFDDEVNNLKYRTDNSKNDEDTKGEILKEIEVMKNQLDKSKGIPLILKKYLDAKNGKFLVFCKNISHLNEMKDIVVEWFIKSKVTKNVDVYSIYTGYKDSDKDLELFKINNSKDSVKLLFSIDMFNEGVHLKNIDGVILLRPTISPIIYYQQIGRAIQAGDANNPLIFDFVNNSVT